ncbi:PHP domain-containing protein [Lysinibacter sp. HNR]|uniref:PHP domain-containing protein n=1 Tax=Lysinibacter sp. HNR TaxID=3031408 RepID=UPI002435A68D|nr:PHP domain-containing protein [Lysinibacter sp. HNR]WGD36390.1 PHP domain-containing protein [Lysinibacter sp. HNR]
MNHSGLLKQWSQVAWTEGRYDLHTHSIASDGTLTPSQIVREAADLGLGGIALTDHDTMAGWAEAEEAAREHGLSFVPGVELTTKTHTGFVVHLLAYFIDPQDAALYEVMERVRRDRDRRARDMVALISQDIALSWADVESLVSDGATIGRPHIADALVSLGFYPDRGAAFNDVLHPGSKYYVPNYAVETLEAVRLVRLAGGLPVLAHPAASRQRAPIPIPALEALVDAGLYGIELDHPENRREWLPPLRSASERLGLMVTGSSDYHGAGKENRLGDCATDASIVRKMATDAGKKR